MSGFATNARTEGRDHAVRQHGEHHLTVEQVCSELQVARSTFYQWRQVGKAPRCVRLPNGAIRIRRPDLDAWLISLAEDAA